MCAICEKRNDQMVSVLTSGSAIKHRALAGGRHLTLAVPLKSNLRWRGNPVVD